MKYVIETLDNHKYVHFKISIVLNYFCSFRFSWADFVSFGDNLCLALTQKKMKAFFQKGLWHTGHYQRAEIEAFTNVPLIIMNSTLL